MSRNTKHFDDFELALFASGDLAAWTRLRVSLHARRCLECRQMVDSFHDSREALRGMMYRLPAGLDESSAEWHKLSAEMTANIRLGLEAGECIAQVPSSRRAYADSRYAERSRWSLRWNPMLTGAGIAVAAMLVVGSAWWLNFPSDSAVLGRAFARMIGHEPLAGTRAEMRGAMVKASTRDIEFSENGGSMGMKLSGTVPVYTSVSFDGSASASYVDPDDGQVTIAKVYTQ